MSDEKAEMTEEQANEQALRDLLAKNIAALTEDVAKQRAVIARLERENEQLRRDRADVMVDLIARDREIRRLRAVYEAAVALVCASSHDYAGTANNACSGCELCDLRDAVSAGDTTLAAKNGAGE